VFSAWVSTPDGLERGTFVADKKGAITTVAYPGDPAPGGGVFTRAGTPDINNGGDVSFRGTASTDSSGAWEIFVRRSATGAIQAITTTGQAAPGGGVFASGDAHHINDPGDVAVTA